MPTQYTPNIDLPYPQATDQVSSGATDFESLAQALDGGSGGSTSGPTAALVKKGVLASLPGTAGPLGSVYICTDTSCAFWSDGSAWHYIPIDSSGPPIGAISQYGGSTDPVDPDGETRWLICDGRAISRSTYAKCFAVLGTTYGPGNGSSTFNIPDGRQRWLLGKSTSGTGQTLGGMGGEIDHNHGAGSLTSNVGLDQGNNLAIQEFPGQYYDGGTYFNVVSKFMIANQLEEGEGGNAVAVAVTGNTTGTNPNYLVVNHIVRVL